MNAKITRRRRSDVAALRDMPRERALALFRRERSDKAVAAEHGMSVDDARRVRAALTGVYERPARGA